MNLGDGSHPRLYILSSNHNVRVTEICIFTNKQLNWNFSLQRNLDDRVVILLNSILLDLVTFLLDRTYQIREDECMKLTVSRVTLPLSPL